MATILTQRFSTALEVKFESKNEVESEREENDYDIFYDIEHSEADFTIMSAEVNEAKNLSKNEPFVTILLCKLFTLLPRTMTIVIKWENEIITASRFLRWLGNKIRLSRLH